MSTTNALRNSLLRLGLVALAVFLASCGGGGGDGSASTTPAGDTTPPTVSGTNPLNGATSVTLNSSVSATFSEAMTNSTLTAATFTLVPTSGGAAVAGSVSVTGNTATFTPLADLAASTPYTATVTTGAKDAAGNALATNFTWSFTTGAAPLFEPLPMTLETVQAAVDLLTTGQIEIPANCSGSFPINCPGGVPNSPVPVALTRAGVSIVQMPAGEYSFSAQVSIASLMDIPITITGADCELAINTAAGASPTVQVAGTAMFASQTTGGAGNRLDLTAILSALETADFILNGGFTCQMANLQKAFLLPLVSDAYSNVVPHHLCGALGPPLFVACSVQP